MSPLDLDNITRMDSKLLRRIHFLQNLAGTKLSRVARTAYQRDFPAKSTIFSKAQSGNHIFFVISGRVRIFTRSQGKKRKTFAYLSPGEFFGELSMVDGHTRSASAEAVVDSRLLIIRKSAFNKLLLSDAKLSCHLLRTVSERLRRANEEIESLLFRNMLGRVSSMLCALSRSGKKFRGGLLLKEHYTQQELADLVGTTREPLTRAISTLRRAQILEVHDGRYLVKNPQKLSGLCLPLTS
ncbi:MAG TPA: hypothetical protein DEB40_13830 [Elusimicrobia bacterium]|nr:hypothetical protein [Elusimicrobiota bacterium]HBT62813.1 hypothetical protein [Elusimicrobiota bacterium]